MTISTESVPASDGILLEGRLRLPDGPCAGGVVLAHPHPGFGGTMDVWLLPAIAARVAEIGWASLRVNFRGVGRSEGRQTDGAEEVADLEGAVAFLRERIGAELPVLAVGWSFGAMVALRLGSAVQGWVGIAPPTRKVDGTPLHGPIVPDELPPRRWVVVGEHDQFFPPDTVDVLAAERVTVLPGTDHFLFGYDRQVADAVVAACEEVAHR